MWQKFYYSEKGLSDLDKRGQRVPHSLVWVELKPHFFSWLLTIERSYQTHSHIHLKIIVLVRRFLLRRRNMSLSKIHCCYIIISTELKEKHTLDQDELSCCVIISSGLKENNVLCD